MTCKQIQTDAITFYKKLGKTIQKKSLILALLLAVPSCISMSDSFFFKKYCSEASIEIPPYAIVKFGVQEPTGIQDNELHFIKQKKALSSANVLGDALSILYTRQAITAKEIESLQSNLTVKRLPFDNTLILTLETDQLHDARLLLGAIIHSYEIWFRNNAVSEANRLKHTLHQELDRHNRRVSDAYRALNDFDNKSAGELLVEQVFLKKKAIQNIDYQLQNLKRLLTAQQNHSRNNLQNNIATNNHVYDYQIFRLEERKSRILSELKRLAELEAKRHLLQRDVDTAEHPIKRLSSKVNDINLFISQSKRISIGILSAPSTPKQINPWWLNLVYGVATGLCLSFLLVYLIIILSGFNGGRLSDDGYNSNL